MWSSFMLDETGRLLDKTLETSFANWEAHLPRCYQMPSAFCARCLHPPEAPKPPCHMVTWCQTIYEMICKRDQDTAGMTMNWTNQWNLLVFSPDQRDPQRLPVHVASTSSWRWPGRQYGHQAEHRTWFISLSWIDLMQHLQMMTSERLSKIETFTTLSDSMLSLGKGKESKPKCLTMAVTHCVQPCRDKEVHSSMTFQNFIGFELKQTRAPPTNWNNIKMINQNVLLSQSKSN